MKRPSEKNNYFAGIAVAPPLYRFLQRVARHHRGCGFMEDLEKLIFTFPRKLWGEKEKRQRIQEWLIEQGYLKYVFNPFPHEETL